ncbi:MAG: aspartate kinase [Marinilabiliales bacterium]|nr:MAG: aspartate kinase [Marinilabiliales bacterium]
MKVFKFGGTSISSPENIKIVYNIISDTKPKIVVFSAIKDITNLLSEFIKQSYVGNWIQSEQIISIIRDVHLDTIQGLFSSNNFKEIAIGKLDASISFLSKFLDKKLTGKYVNEILAQGELLSTMIIYLYMLENGDDVAFLQALSFIKLTKEKEPDYPYIEDRLKQELSKHLGCKLFITQGFICSNHKNEIANLNRGGSDYTATVIGKALKADFIEIWTDIDGLQNNDPRFVKETKTIRSLSYEEASELAFFGAKILHPLTLKPIQNENIPLSIKNTFDPSKEGTLIHNNKKSENLKAIASKDGITTIKLKSGKMMQAYGYLKKVFEVFEKYHTSVDMLTTSEISVAMTIENRNYIQDIVSELEPFGDLQIENNQSIICIVQDYLNDTNFSIQEIIVGLKDVPIKMISFGSSTINLSIIVDTENKPKAMEFLNSHVLKNEPCLAQS